MHFFVFITSLWIYYFTIDAYFLPSMVMDVLFLAKKISVSYTHLRAHET